MLGKNTMGTFFETFEANLVVLSITLVKLHFTKLALAAMFFKSVLPKINMVLLISNINDCTKKTIGESSLSTHKI